mmetsp:Transcript_22841/g.52118  ORF Transcript_22841/g.52118 Transcript_22841/m.52118 type:complete len:279 (+) Transcript_22841:15-851(+)
MRSALRRRRPAPPARQRPFGSWVKVKPGVLRAGDHLDLDALQAALGETGAYGATAALVGKSRTCYLGSGVAHGSAMESAVLNAFSHGEVSVTAAVTTQALTPQCKAILSEIVGSRGLDLRSPEPMTRKPDRPRGFLLKPAKQCSDGQWRNFRVTPVDGETQDELLVSQAAEGAALSYTPFSRLASGVAAYASTGFLFRGSLLEIPEWDDHTQCASILPARALEASLVANGSSLAGIAQAVLCVDSRTDDQTVTRMAEQLLAWAPQCEVGVVRAEAVAL